MTPGRPADVPLPTDRGALSLPLPEGWETVIGRQALLPAVAVAPVSGSGPGFRSSIVVTVDRLGSTTLDRWQRSAEPALGHRLDEYLLLDLERVEVFGLPGARRLALHRWAPGVHVTMEQRMVVHWGVGVTITVTTATPSFPTERPILVPLIEAGRFVPADAEAAA